MKFGLPEPAIHKIRLVLMRHPEVEQAVLYGSRAKGNFNQGSDIDLALAGGPSLTLPALSRISDELDDLLLPYTIDLALLSNISDPELLAHIQRVGLVFCAREQGERQLPAANPQRRYPGFTK